jgi:hypothetical protein
MGADDEADRQRLARGGARLVDGAQVAGRYQVDPGLATAAQHEAAYAHIGPTSLRIDDEIDRRRDIGAAIGAVPKVDRQRGEIGVRAGEHHLLRGRLGARDIDNVRLVAQPPQQLAQQLVRGHAECARDPRAAAGDVADELLALRTDRAKQHRLGIAFEDLCDLGEVGRRAHRLELIGASAVSQALDEPAQSEPVEIQRRYLCLRLLDDAHWLSSMAWIIA